MPLACEACKDAEKKLTDAENIDLTQYSKLGGTDKFIHLAAIYL